MTAGCTGPTCNDAAKLWIFTDVHNAAHNVITTIAAPAVVHDKFIAAAGVGGTVKFTLYEGGTCSGNLVAVVPNPQVNVPLVGGSAESNTVTLNPSATTTYSYRAHYNGDVPLTFPAQDAACEPFTVTAAPKGLITHTQVACRDVLSGAAATMVIGQVNYPSSGGKIGQGINPGKFFYWTQITTTIPNQVVTVSQTNTSTNNMAKFLIHQGWARVYTGNCASYKSGTEIAGGSGASFTIRRRARTSSASSTTRSRSQVSRCRCLRRSRTTSRPRSAAIRAPRCCSARLGTEHHAAGVAGGRAEDRRAGGHEPPALSCLRHGGFSRRGHGVLVEHRHARTSVAEKGSKGRR